MKYFILFFVVLYFIVFAFVGCNPYRSKSKTPSKDEQSFVDYSYGDFDEVPESGHFEEVPESNVYYIKYIHLGS